MSTTIDEFLEPGADELHHILDGELRSSSGGRYDVVGQPELWQAFHSRRISSSVEMRASLDNRITPVWQAWLPGLARIIYSERQLESLYNCTLITRVNIALHNTIRSEEPRITIINCGASFDSDVSGSTVATILPDWIVIEGDFSPHDTNPPDLEQLASDGKIVAVGDTKLFQRQSTTGARKGESENRQSVVEGTHSCHPGWLAQVQHYARILRTRFGFILTNKELVLGQFLREDEASPRVQRGLRSSTLPDQLHRGLPSDFKSSDARGSDDRGGHDEQLLRTPQPRQKRRHESGDSGTLPPSSPPHRIASAVQSAQEFSGIGAGRKNRSENQRSKLAGDSA